MFIKRADLTPEKRMEIAFRAQCAKGVYGEITKISRNFSCSRLFVYQQFWISRYFFEYDCSEFDSGYVSTSEEYWKRLVLLLKLENTASVKSISRTLKYLGIKNNSVGYISQKLQKYGNSLDSTLKSGEVLSVLINADEIYAGNRPILITIDPVSMAILKIQLADNCQGITWKDHWESISEEGFQLDAVATDRGKGLLKGAKLAGLSWFSDQFHELRPFTKIIEGSIFSQARKAIEAADKAHNREKQIKAEEAIDFYDAHDYLRRILLSSLPFLDAQGKFRDKEWIRGEVSAALELMVELGHKDIKPLAENLLGRLSEVLKYLECVERIHKEITRVYPKKEEWLECFCLLWKHTKGVVIRRGEARRYHRDQKETWEKLLQSDLGEEYQWMREMIFQKLDSIPRTSSLVESVNSLIRPYLNSCKGKITQEMLNLVMFRHNYHRFAEGKRKGKAPIEILTGQPLTENWLDLLVKKVS